MIASHRTPAVLAGLAVAILYPVSVGMAAGPAAPSTSSTSAGIGPAVIDWVAVSPRFEHSGLVAAIGAPTGCVGSCSVLWVSHDGGASWHRAGSHGWSPRALEIAVDAQGHEVLYGAGATLVYRSEDYGETFAPVGTGGMPTILPSFATDPGAIVVATVGVRTDYVIQGGAAHDVDGSRDVDVDLQFTLSPTFPNSGRFSPALLAATTKRDQPLVYRCTSDFACSEPVGLVRSLSPYATAASTRVVVAPDYAEHGTVFADTSTSIEKSTDGGATFQPLVVVPPMDGVLTTFSPLALAPEYNETGPVRTAYVAVRQVVTGFGTPLPHPPAPGGIYRTQDGGQSWAPLTTFSGFAEGGSAVTVAPDGRLFAGFGTAATGGLVCSTDAGATWHASCPPVGDTPATATPAQTFTPIASVQPSAGGGLAPIVAAGAGILVVLGVGSSWVLVRRRRGLERRQG